jgi:hypothetical protein
MSELNLHALRETAQAAKAKYEHDGVLEYPSAHPDTWLALLARIEAAEARVKELRRILAALLVFSESGRIAGHQLSDSERDALYAEARAALEAK